MCIKAKVRAKDPDIPFESEMMTTTFIEVVVVLVLGVVMGTFGECQPDVAPRYPRGISNNQLGGGYQGGNGFSGGNGFGNGNGGGSGSGSGAAEVFKFVTIHAPPPEFDGPKRPSSGGPRVIYEKGPRDKNYNIIFVRAPTPPPHPHTRVILPQPAQQKTLVYILHKKPEGPSSNVKITYPKPTTPTKPEVFFVSYNKAGKGQGQGQGQGGFSSGSGVGGGSVQQQGGYA